MGGPEKIRRQRDAGRLTVRERIAALLDDGSFHEIGALAGTAGYDEAGELASFIPAHFVTGTGRLDGRKVVVGGDDFTVRGGAADASIAGKQIYAERLANELHLPIVRLAGDVDSHRTLPCILCTGLATAWLSRNVAGGGLERSAVNAHGHP
jgi:acetyl-CoA carboxylase carboxyltransferase component